jgi:predicted nuclease of predicted toxin-antitoxin system
VIRLLADENVPHASVERMRGAGVDVARAEPGASDRDVLALAAEEQRVVVTFDLDFGRLALQLDAPEPLGVIVLRTMPGDAEAAGRLLLELLARDDVRFEHTLTVVRSHRLRQRALAARR